MKLRLKASIAAAIAASALVAGCGGGSEKDLLGSAQEFVRKGDLDAATIQLKNALQKNPSSAEARFMLGALLFDRRDMPSAELELRKAQELKHPAVAVTPLLARVMLEQKKNKKLIEEFANTELPNALASADLKTTLATAVAREGDRERAQALVDAALKAAPDFLPAEILQVRLLAGGGDVDGALTLLQTATTKTAPNLEALQLEGDLKLRGKADLAGAVEAYAKAVALSPKYLPTRSALIDTLLAKGDLAAAIEQIDALKKALPAHPESRFYEAQGAFLVGDFGKARELIVQLLGIAPANVRLLQFAGAVELQLNSLLQAEIHLSKALSSMPELPKARRLLARTYLRSGQPAKALSTLRPILDGTSVDSESLTLAAEAYLQTGDTGKSEGFFRRAAKLTPGDSRIRTALALTDLAKGHADTALAELQSIATSDKGSLADMAMINVRLRRNELDGALKAVAALEQKQPDKPLAANLRGQILVLRQDLDGARKSFEQALAKDPVYFPAVVNLATLDLRDNRPDAAQSRYEALLKVEPKHWQALMALAALRLNQGAARPEVTQLIDRAIQASIGEATPHLMLVDYLLASKDPKAAVTAAQAGLAAMPNDPHVLDGLGRAQLAAGERLQAISSFDKVVTLRPTSPQPLLRLADAYLQNNDYDAAERSLKRALGISPDLRAAQRGMIRLAVRSKNPERAIQVAREVQKQRPGEATGYLFEGDVYAGLHHWDDAAAALRRGVEVARPGILPARLHFMLNAAKKPAEADKFAAEWLKLHPKDTGFLFYIGSAAFAANDFDQAERRNQEVVNIDPQNALAYNNLAWLLMKQKKPGALPMAIKAAAIAPREPTVLDTLAQAQAEENQLAKAVETAERVVTLAPEAPLYRLNLAKLYVKSGQKQKAKTELSRLAQLGAKFNGQSEVTSLLKGLADQ